VNTTNEEQYCSILVPLDDLLARIQALRRAIAIAKRWLRIRNSSTANP
jgi:hypothetical protein